MKDPAFLFYTSDFLTGTMLYTNEQVGRYIRALCYIHQHGHVSLEELKILIGEDEMLLKKFIQDNEGNYFNKRLEVEINNRVKYIEKQRENGSKGGRPKNPNETQTKPKDKHFFLENINEIVIEIINYLNDKTNRNYNPNAEKNKSVIIARLNEGYKIEDFKKVIDKKTKDWLKDKNFNEYLRPETLFSNKFDGYLNKEEVIKNIKDVSLDMSIMED